MKQAKVLTDAELKRHWQSGFDINPRARQMNDVPFMAQTGLQSRAGVNRSSSRMMNCVYLHFRIACPLPIGFLRNLQSNGTFG